MSYFFMFNQHIFIYIFNQFLIYPVRCFKTVQSNIFFYHLKELWKYTTMLNLLQQHLIMFVTISVICFLVVSFPLHPYLTNYIIPNQTMILLKKVITIIGSFRLSSIELLLTDHVTNKSGSDYNQLSLLYLLYFWDLYW